MKTPDETKRNIITCMELNMEKFMPGATQKALADALALIQQLEAERDVYREGLKTEVGCYGCKHYVDDPDYDSNECMSCGKNMCNFEWRGVQKEETP